MRKILLIFLLIGGVLNAQKQIGIVITGYDLKKDDWENAKVTFVDTSYYQIDAKAWSVLEKDSVFYNLYQEIPQIKGVELCNFYMYADFWGSDSFYNSYEVLFNIVKNRLTSLRKL